MIDPELAVDREVPLGQLFGQCPHRLSSRPSGDVLTWGRDHDWLENTWAAICCTAGFCARRR